MKKRLFVSIPIPKEAQAALSASQNRQAYRLRWVDPSQFHMTVCFIGDTEEELLVLVSDALTEVSKQSKPFAVPFERLGLFPPKLARPNMVWAFFKESEAFETLAKRSKDALMKADASFMRLGEEWRKDIPHVTLARFRGSEFPRSFQDPAPFEVMADRIELMESVLYPDGPLYTTLASFPFTA